MVKEMNCVNTMKEEVRSQKVAKQVLRQLLKCCVPFCQVTEPAVS